MRVHDNRHPCGGGAFESWVPIGIRGWHPCGGRAARGSLALVGVLFVFVFRTIVPLDR